jgi:hypothetical protein
LQLKITYQGDINLDGTLNQQDLKLLNQAFGSSSGSANWNQNADLNKDGVVDANDLYILSENFGKKAF